MASYRIRYQTLEIGEQDIHLCTLRDLNQYSDDQGAAARAGIPPATWPLFGVVWPSSMILTHHMLDWDTEGLRILEIGCGIGLTSLMLQQRNEDITATDRHPEVRGFLERNATLNGLNAIPYSQCDWEDDEDNLGLFDLLLGSDLVYEPGQAEMLAAFIERHASERCEIVIVDAGRREQTRFNGCMEHLGFTHTSQFPTDIGFLEQPFRGRIRHYSRR